MIPAAIRKASLHRDRPALCDECIKLLPEWAEHHYYFAPMPGQLCTGCEWEDVFTVWLVDRTGRGSWVCEDRAPMFRQTNGRPLPEEVWDELVISDVLAAMALSGKTWATLDTGVEVEAA